MKKIILLTILLALICTSFLVAAKVSAFEPLEELIPRMKIPIPQLEPFQKPTYVEEGGKGYIFIPWIAQYVSAMYKYALAIGSIIAVIAVMVGGILYLTSGGAPGRIDQGKNIIIGAITGLLIIIFSYIFLNTINPELVNLKAIRIQAVKQEALVVGNNCKDLGAGFIVRTPSGEKEGTTGNAQYFACGSSYPVRSGAADVIVPEGQNCDGAYCQKGACETVDGKPQCVNALFTGEITGTMLSGGRYIDEEFELWGMPGNGLLAAFPVPSKGRYVIPLTAELENKLNLVDKVYFHLQINTTGAYPYWAYKIGKEGVVDVDLIKETVKSYFKTTIDSEFYAVKSYKDPEKAIWGFPYSLDQMSPLNPSYGNTPCDPCFVMPRNAEWRFEQRLPWCQFWEPTDLLVAAKSGSGTVVNFNIDDFPEYPQWPPPVLVKELLLDNISGLPTPEFLKGVKYEDIDWNNLATINPDLYPYMTDPAEFCVASSQLTSASPFPGTPCTSPFETAFVAADDANAPDDLKGKTLYCRPAGYQVGSGTAVAKFEWTLEDARKGDTCDNLSVAQSFPGQFSAGQTAKNDGQPFVNCESGVSCQWVSGDVGECINGLTYCFGFCEDDEAVLSMGIGDPCRDGTCLPYKGSIELKCVLNGNARECLLGTWGSFCNTDNDCKDGFECIKHDTTTTDEVQFCAKKNAGRWQACGDKISGSGTNCSSGLDCEQVEYGEEGDSDAQCDTGHWSGADTNNLKFCLESTYDDNNHGICSCSNNSNCANTYGWDSGANYCNLAGYEYCSQKVEGAWCKVEGKTTPDNYFCHGVGGEYGVLHQKISTSQ